MQSRNPRPPADDPGPSELAARLLESHYPYSAARDRPRLFAAALPDDPPFDVPIPDGFALVGSAALAPRRDRRMVEAVLDTALSAAGVRALYRDLLSDGGWEEDHRTDHGGFASGPGGFLLSFVRNLRRSARRKPVDLPGLSTIFRREAPRQLLIVSAEERRGHPTDVRLRLIAGGDPMNRHRRNDPEALFAIPTLTPPPRARVSDEGRSTGLLAPPFDARTSGGGCGGSGGEYDGAYSFAALESDLDLPSLIGHYEIQLEDAGWSKTDEGRDGPQAWNTWTFSDDEAHPWEASLTVLHLPRTPRRYLLNLRADRTPDP